MMSFEVSVIERLAHIEAVLQQIKQTNEVMWRLMLDNKYLNSVPLGMGWKEMKDGPSA